MSEFNFHGWNDPTKVELPINQTFRVEIDSDGEIYKYIGQTEEDGSIYLEEDGLLCPVNFGNLCPGNKARIRLWEED